MYKVAVSAILCCVHLHNTMPQQLAVKALTNGRHTLCVSAGLKVVSVSKPWDISEMVKLTADHCRQSTRVVTCVLQLVARGSRVHAIP